MKNFPLIFFTVIFLKYYLFRERAKKNKYKSDYKYCWLIVIGCIPAGLMGLVFSKFDVSQVKKAIRESAVC